MLPVEVLELHGAYFAGLILILAALLDGLFVESRSCCKHVVRDRTSVRGLQGWLQRLCLHLKVLDVALLAELSPREEPHLGRGERLCLVLVRCVQQQAALVSLLLGYQRVVELESFATEFLLVEPLSTPLVRLKDRWSREKLQRVRVFESHRQRTSCVQAAPRRGTLTQARQEAVASLGALRARENDLVDHAAAVIVLAKRLQGAHYLLVHLVALLAKQVLHVLADDDALALSLSSLRGMALRGVIGVLLALVVLFGRLQGHVIPHNHRRRLLLVSSCYRRLDNRIRVGSASLAKV